MVPLTTESLWMLAIPISIILYIITCIFIGIWVYRDCKNKSVSIKWVYISAFVPFFIGFAIYILIKNHTKSEKFNLHYSPKTQKIFMYLIILLVTINIGCLFLSHYSISEMMNWDVSKESKNLNENQDDSNYELNFDYWNLHYQVELSYDSDNKIDLQYSIHTEKGSIDAKIIDEKGNTLEKLPTNTDGYVSVSLKKNKKYFIDLKGKKAENGYINISWFLS